MVWQKDATRWVGLAVGLATWTMAQEAAKTSTSANLPPVVVEAKRFAPVDDKIYTVTNAHTATWTDIPLIHTPIMADVIPAQVMEDQGSDRLKDVYQNISGVAEVKTEARGIQFEESLVRGFSQRQLVDGFLPYCQPTINLAGVDRVEVLKGPASSLYGAIEPGGFGNVFPKLPSFDASTTIYGQAGSYDRYRSGVDSTGPLSSNVAYRMILDYENGRSFRDGLEKQDYFAAPSLTWVFPDQTRLTAWCWYQHLDRPQDNGLVFSTNNFRRVGPISRNLAGEGHNNQTIDDAIGALELEHPVNDNLTLNSRLMVHYFDAVNDCVRWSSFRNNILTPYYDASSFNNMEYDWLNYAVLRGETGPLHHTVVGGFELSRSDYFYDRLISPNLTPISIFSPVYPTGPYNATKPAGTREQETLSQAAAGFLQDQVDMVDNTLHLLVGGRADYVYQFYQPWNNLTTVYNQHDMGYSGRAGLIYDLTSWLAPYVNVCRSFNPQTAGGKTTFTGEPLNPTTGIQYESGLKFHMLNDRLQFTTAAFQITKDNVAVNDQDHLGYQLNGGSMRSEGFDVSLLGQLTPELQAVGSYAYTDTRVIKSTALPIDAPLAGVPLNSGSLWLKYTFQDGTLRGFGGGVGCFVADDRAGDSMNTFTLPGYVRWDAGTWYAFAMSGGQVVKFQLNVQNIFDRIYYESSSGVSGVQPGSPLSVVGRVSITF